MRRLIGIANVCWLIGRSRSTVDRYLKCPPLNFPPPVRLGPRDRGWYEDEIVAWMEARPRRPGPAAGSNPNTQLVNDRAADAPHARDTGR